MIRPVELSDAQCICSLYNYYVLNTHVNFEEEAVSVTEMESRIATASEKHPWFVYELEGHIIGYAYAGAWKGRCSYRYSVETTVYVQYGMQGKGIGSALYKVLFEALSKQ